MRNPALFLGLLLVALPGQAASQSDSQPNARPNAQPEAQPDRLPFKNDATGIHWVLPFKRALKQATQERRLLVIKPIAFGTDKEGGW